MKRWALVPVVSTIEDDGTVSFSHNKQAEQRAAALLAVAKEAKFYCDCWGAPDGMGKALDALRAVMPELDAKE